ncbi:hypothetical protein ACFL96_07855 [Thermoproteota archaeon]
MGHLGIALFIGAIIGLALNPYVTTPLNPVNEITTTSTVTVTSSTTFISTSIITSTISTTITINSTVTSSNNQPATSSIAIETVTGIVSIDKPSLTILVRNVGGTVITVGSVTISGLSSNSGFVGSLSATVSDDTTLDVNANDGSSWIGTGTDLQMVAEGSGIIINLVGPTTGATQTTIQSGDVVTVKVTTDKGTFAQASYTIP